MRLTRKNPTHTVDTYRAPLINGATARFESSIAGPALFGTVVDKLGMYEDLGEYEDIKRVIEAQKITPRND